MWMCTVNKLMGINQSDLTRLKIEIQISEYCVHVIYPAFTEN